MSMPGFIDLTNQTFGDWIAIRYLGDSMWECINSKGEIKNIHSYTLRTRLSNHTKLGSKQPNGILGNTFGQWTPIKYIGGGFWECKCTCGNVGKVNTYDLKNGLSTKCKDCAKLGRMKTVFNTGDKIGEWTVMHYAGDMRWHCKCSCGKEKDVLTKYLKDGTSKSCGHDRNYHIVRDDITGRRFGSLVVLGYTGANNMWKCQCDCGNVKNIHRDSLMTGKTKSCGCLKETMRVQTLFDKYGDTNTTRINNPREDWQIEILSNRDLLKQYIDQLGGKVTAADLAINLNVNDTSILKALKKHGLTDVVEHNKGVSDIELSILNWLNTFGLDIICNDRTILNGKEIDMYIPSRKLAIEFNGSYWHSSIFRDTKYHQNKTLDCARKGIHLIHIFEYEWRDALKQRKIKDYISSLLGKNNIIYARNTTLRYINDIEKIKEFLNDNHLQGYATSSINIGCFYRDEIVGLMTFGKSRFDESNQYEIVRLCWKSGLTVIGGTEKIFYEFIKRYNPTSVITYCDISKFTGNVYTRLGFKPYDVVITKPNYVWVNMHNSKVLKRYQTMKSKLISNGLDKLGNTEDEIMESLGYIKVYDSGNLKLSWTKQK